MASGVAQRARVDGESRRAPSLPDLTRAVFGESLTLSEAYDRLSWTNGAQRPEKLEPTAVWLGSIGYERYRDVERFVQRLSEARVERLIDVRELPISRRRGYAKTALSETLGAAGIEYLHMRQLGNPKPYRDLYKSGRTREGRQKYTRLLLTERRGALVELRELLTEKRSALMCVEEDQCACHRDVIIESLQAELGVALSVASLSDS